MGKGTQECGLQNPYLPNRTPPINYATGSPLQNASAFSRQASTRSSNSKKGRQALLGANEKGALTPTCCLTSAEASPQHDHLPTRAEAMGAARLRGLVLYSTPRGRWRTP